MGKEQVKDICIWRITRNHKINMDKVSLGMDLTAEAESQFQLEVQKLNDMMFLEHGLNFKTFRKKVQEFDLENDAQLNQIS